MLSIVNFSYGMSFCVGFMIVCTYYDILALFLISYCILLKSTPLSLSQFLTYCFYCVWTSNLWFFCFNISERLFNDNDNGDVDRIDLLFIDKSFGFDIRFKKLRFWFCDFNYDVNVERSWLVEWVNDYCI